MSDDIKARQAKFDAKYISSTEVMEYMGGMSRAAIHFARKRGQLPPPLKVRGSGVCIWEREVLQPYLERWKAQSQTI